MGKVVDVNKALDVIRDCDVIAVSGFNMATTPEYLLLKLYERYGDTGHPRGLFIVTDSLPAAKGRALDLIAERMIKENDRLYQGLHDYVLRRCPIIAKACY